MEQRGEFRVSVGKDYLIFAAAHFVTLAGHHCEGLHGHNYRARVAIEGRLDCESWLVLDFVVLKRIMRRLCRDLDHKVLLPLANPKLEVVVDGESVSVAYCGERRYLFPRGDCALLPVPNTTVEMLAELFADRLGESLAASGVTGLAKIEMEIEESAGQSAVYRASLS